MSLEDNLNQVKGSVKEGLGKVTGDKKTEAEGVAEKVASKAKEVAEDAKEVAEDAKEAVEGAIKGVKNILHKDDN
ncbi:CsbD family protein [Streptococcus australis]|uniref:CsbD family protein n=1 Tax=Streptococcus australis TaxID=113107 RepID=UPI0018A06016|nr:CsbD family protein [Streptococcus australis]